MPKHDKLERDEKPEETGQPETPEAGQPIVTGDNPGGVERVEVRPAGRYAQHQTRAELARLEARRAELKKLKPDDLHPDEYAAVKGRIAALKAELGESY